MKHPTERMGSRFVNMREEYQTEDKLDIGYYELSNINRTGQYAR